MVHLLMVIKFEVQKLSIFYLLIEVIDFQVFIFYNYFQKATFQSFNSSVFSKYLRQFQDPLKINENYYFFILTYKSFLLIPAFLKVVLNSLDNLEKSSIFFSLSLIKLFGINKLIYFFTNQYGSHELYHKVYLRICFKYFEFKLFW